MNAELLQSLAEKVGTPYWICDAALLRQRIAAIKLLTEGEGLQARYAMKALPATRILKEMLDAGLAILADFKRIALSGKTVCVRRLTEAEAMSDGALSHVRTALSWPRIILA